MKKEKCKTCSKIDICQIKKNNIPIILKCGFYRFDQSDKTNNNKLKTIRKVANWPL